ncbi:MAG: DMT family transporter [Flavobacteriales bacterium]
MEKKWFVIKDEPNVSELHRCVKVKFGQFFTPTHLSAVRPRHILYLAILALTWGSSFILMHKAMKGPDDKPLFAPGEVATLRLCMAATILLPVAIRAFRHVKRRDWKWLAVVGLAGSGLPAFLFTNAQAEIESAMAGILNSLTPFFTLILGIFLFSKKFLPRQFIGIVVGMAGATLLIAIKGFEGGNHWQYALLIVLATMSYGLSVNVIPAKLGHMHSLHISALSLLIAGLPCFVYLLQSDILTVVANHQYGWHGLGYISILAVMGTAVAGYLYFRLALETTALLASSVAYLMPIVAVGWGIADGELLSWKHIACAGLILIGVYLVNKAKRP